jgi:aspartyl-tRNA(Asn)/glutamyl-tRNA(Gln) amidotransferase subunit C
MALSEEDVTRIARLARIELSLEQRNRAKEELNRILPLFDRLQAIDTRGVEPVAQPLSAHVDIALPLRDDTATVANAPTRRTELMANAPEASEGLFLVPKVLE